MVVDIKNVELTDKVVERWKSIKFTDGLDDETETKRALAFERMAYYLLWNDVDNDSLIEDCAFPCVRRVVQTICEDVMPEPIVDELQRLNKFLNSEKFFMPIDFECELTELSASNVIKSHASPRKVNPTDKIRWSKPNFSWRIFLCLSRRRV